MYEVICYLSGQKIPSLGEMDFSLSQIHTVLNSLLALLSENGKTTAWNFCSTGVYFSDWEHLSEK